MKVVLFCGGRGMRIRDYSDQIPKPMVPIGYRPVLWHVMKYYAHYGHKEFILCLGYKADVIKDYFLNYNECLSNDFVLSRGGKDVKLLSTDIEDWSITFVDTGVDANIGQRLKAVEPHVAGEEFFLANYSDGLTDFELPSMVNTFPQQEQICGFLCVRPRLSYHIVNLREEGTVRAIKEISVTDMWINGGYFMFRTAIFDYIRAGEDLVYEPFRRLIEKNRLIGIKHDGFWMSMDTFKDKQQLEELYLLGDAPWTVWKRN